MTENVQDVQPMQGNELPEAVDSNEDAVLEVLEEEQETAGNKEQHAEDVPRYKVKINGQERETTLDELISGYQKVTAADAKFNEAASYRKQAEERLQQAQAYREAYEAKLEKFIPETENVLNQYKQAIEYYSQPQTNETYEERVERLSNLEAARSEFQKRAELYQQAIGEKEQLKAQKQQEYSQYAQLRLAEAQKALINEIPEWNDKSKREKESSEVQSWMKKQGLTDTDIEAINQGTFGHYPIVMARKAMLYDALMQKVASRKGSQSEMTNAPEPVTNVRSIGGAGKDPSKMSTEEWMKWRENQIRKRK